MRRRARTASAILTVAALLMSCGKSGSSTAAPNGTELLDRLSPAGQPAVVYVDLHAVRTALGIGELDPRKTLGTDVAQRRYAALYASAFPLLAKAVKVPLLDM